MADKIRERPEASRLTTVLDPLRPAVVVRRRVYEATPLDKGASPRAFSTERGAVRHTTEDENGPPSSINVARALASLRAEELQRVEEIVKADDVPPARARAESPAPRPTLLLGKTIHLAKLADQMKMDVKDLTGRLVASGFYSLHAKTVVPRETARTIAEMFGWRVDDAPDTEELEAASPKRRATRSKTSKASKRRR